MSAACSRFTPETKAAHRARVVAHLDAPINPLDAIEKALASADKLSLVVSHKTLRDFVHHVDRLGPDKLVIHFNATHGQPLVIENYKAEVDE